MHFSKRPVTSLSDPKTMGRVPTGSHNTFAQVRKVVLALLGCRSVRAGAHLFPQGQEILCCCQETLHMAASVRFFPIWGPFHSISDRHLKREMLKPEGLIVFMKPFSIASDPISGTQIPLLSTWEAKIYSSWLAFSLASRSTPNLSSSLLKNNLKCVFPPPTTTLC